MAWLRRKDTAVHINVAELTAVVRGIAMALKWKVRDLTIITDSASVHWWLEALVTGDNRIRVKGDSEMLVRRRLEIINETLNDYAVDWRVKRVASHENKADELTRVPKNWLRTPVAGVVVGAGGSPEQRAAERAHDFVHHGVKATLHFAKELLNSVTEDDARRAVQSCEWCNSISPQPIRAEVGNLGVERSGKGWPRMQPMSETNGS